MGTIDNPLGDDKRIKLEMPGLGNKIKKVTILQDCFSYPRFFVFPCEVQNCFSKVCRESCVSILKGLH